MCVGEDGLRAYLGDHEGPEGELSSSSGLLLSRGPRGGALLVVVLVRPLLVSFSVSGHPTRSLRGTAVRVSAPLPFSVTGAQRSVVEGGLLSGFFCLSSRRHHPRWKMGGVASVGAALRWKLDLLCALPEVVVVALWVVVPVFGCQLSS